MDPRNLENELVAADGLGEVMELAPAMLTVRATKMFTEGDGALIVVLWSGCHANVRPEKCPSSNLLRPGAGWAD